MAEENKDVKKEEPNTSSVSAVDEKGVPWMNRVKELERKYQDALEKISNLTVEEVEETPPPTPVDVDEELKEFVKNPKAYHQKIYEEMKSKEQLEVLRKEADEAVVWLEKQKDYDKDMVIQTIRKYNLEGIPSPQKQAEVAWGIIERERLQRQFDGNKERGTMIDSTRSEAPGRSVPEKPKSSRADLISQLHEASSKGDLVKQAEIIGMLEDVRA